MITPDQSISGNLKQAICFHHRFSAQQQTYPPVFHVSELHAQLTWSIPWMHPLRKISNYCGQDYKHKGYHITLQEIKNEEGDKKHLMHINHKKPLTLLRKTNPIIFIADACEILITSRADA